MIKLELLYINHVRIYFPFHLISMHQVSLNFQSWCEPWRLNFGVLFLVSEPLGLHVTRERNQKSFHKLHQAHLCWVKHYTNIRHDSLFIVIGGWY